MREANNHVHALRLELGYDAPRGRHVVTVVFNVTALSATVLGVQSYCEHSDCFTTSRKRKSGLQRRISDGIPRQQSVVITYPVEL